MPYTEEKYENAIIQLFEEMGYTHAYGPAIDRDHKTPLYMDELTEALYRLNPTLTDDAINDALFKLQNFENGEFVQKNAVFMDYLQNGIEVRYTDKGEERSAICYLVDYANTDSNSFIVANQWTFVENDEKRPDVLLFINGLPVVLMELKSPSREETDASEAYTQIRNYMHSIPSMFIYNAICVMSDLSQNRAGTINSGEDRYMEWKTKDGSYENTQFAQFDTFFEGIFTKDRLLDILKNFILFSNEGLQSFKILAGYHQYFAVRKAVESTKRATVTDGKGGVFWHTQGSGKSLSMVFYAHLLQSALESPTIVVITDRNDLDDQLYSQFAKCKDFLRQEPVHAESRVMKLKLDESTLKLIDTEYDIMAQNADTDVIEKSKRELGKMEAILGHDDTIKSLVDDILNHYENYRENLLTGKAMIVAYSRAIAMKIYKRILEIRPGWEEKVAVVMKASNKDPEEWHNIIGNKRHKEELAKKFKDNDSPLKIAIVVDMWLTGFDVPSLATMYVYKPMIGYNLMQAIARVNRVFRDKEGGLVVDYVGIAGALKQAMNDYTVRDKKNYGNTDIAQVAYPKFQEKLQICRDLLHEFDYSAFFGGNELTAGRTITGAVNFLMDRKREKDREGYTKEALLLKQALSLCSSIAEEDEREEAAFFEAVRVLLMRILNQGGGKKLSLPEINAKINELLKQSIKSDGVINLFSDKEQDFSLFDPKFLEEISKMKEKNLAVELLKRLIAEQVHIYKRTNLVKSEKFSEIMQSAMNRYLNGMLTNEEVIQEMLNLAKQISEAKEAGEELGLTADELAFYDALTKPQAIKDFYENAELIAITKELAEKLRKSRTIDWQKRDSARAKMRMMIRKLLKEHRYPPEGMDDAVTTVMQQCELWADNIMSV